MMKYGLLGEKLSHSYSSLIHQYIYEQLHLEASYELLECQEVDLKKAVYKLKQQEYKGYNVTIPYKKAILPYLDEVDEKAREIGSVNTLYLKNGRVIGTNTDYDGFLATIQQHQIQLLGKQCYILGTGGASLAVAKVCRDLGGKVTFVSRNPVQYQISYEMLEEASIDVLINTTPVGMYPNVGACPISDEVIHRAGVVMDIIFNPEQTELLRKANSKINGLTMLIYQAIKAEEIWQNKRIVLPLEALYNQLKGK